MSHLFNLKCRVHHFLHAWFVLPTAAIMLTVTANAGNSTDDSPDSDEYYAAENGAQFAETNDGAEISDPLYRVNYGLYVVNDRLYLHVMEPVASAYADIVPETMRNGVRNFFVNLRAPVRFVNCLLQGKGTDAWEEVKIFAVNTVVGVVGLDKAAQRFLELQINEEDLGQTLATYGIGEGWYLYWPFFGPSTVRDTVGMIGDGFVDPLSYVKSPWDVGLRVYKAENSISLNQGKYEEFKTAAFDPYYAFQDFYIQTRDEAIGK